MSTLKRLALPLTPEAVRGLWRLLGRLFGARRRRLLIHPILGAIVAVSETISLLSIIRLLLLLVDGGDVTELSVGPVDAALSFGEVAAVAAVTLALTLAVRLLEGRATAVHQAQAMREARRLTIDAWFAADWEQLHTARLGRLQQLLGVNAQQAVIPVQLLSVASVAMISLAVYVTIVLISAPTIALLFAGVAVLSAAVMNPLRRTTKRLARAQARMVGDLQLAATSYAHLNRELHVFGVQQAAADRLNEMSATTAAGFARLRFLQRLLPAVYQQVLLAAIVAIVLVGRELDVEAVQFGTAAILAVRSLSYVQQLNSALQVYIETQPFLDELLDSVTENREKRRPRGDQELGPVRSIRLEQVGYRYPAGTQALHGVDLELVAGDWLGIIGPSGGGKTTLANLIAGLLTPTEGSLAVNGGAASSYTAASWNAQFALLSQEPVLLAESVAENIAFHRPALPAAIRAAAERAGVDREIDGLAERFDTLVGEGHSSLSGGQRQRIALARSLLGAPSCLILDEPTSALDAANEALVEQSLLGIPDGTIVVVVSHRRALLGRCNRFVVLEHGRLVAEGDAEAIDLARRVGGA